MPWERMPNASALCSTWNGPPPGTTAAKGITAMESTASVSGFISGNYLSDTFTVGAIRESLIAQVHVLQFRRHRRLEMKFITQLAIQLPRIDVVSTAKGIARIEQISGVGY